MSSNERRICEYFLISGFNKTRKPYDLSQIYQQGEEIFNTNVNFTEDFFHYKEPIVDIQIINGHSREKVPPGYQIVDRTYSKQSKAHLYGKVAIEELYLCFRCGRDDPPITDIWVFNAKQKSAILQEQWVMVEKTVSGHSANLSSSSSNPIYLAYKRALPNDPVDNLAVTDICVIVRNKNELCPPAYSQIDVPIKRSPLNSTINVCFKKSMVKEHVLSFQPEIIYCLPCTSTDPIVDIYNVNADLVKSESCLPEDIGDVANFCMPWGATLESWSATRSIPKPSFLTFVLTNINYNRMYGAAVLFYEEIDPEELTDDEIANLGLVSRTKITDNAKIFCSKSLCLLSRWPLFQTFNQVLSFLIQEDERQRTNSILSSSPYSLPIERFVSQFLHTVAFPTPEAPNVLLQWDLENPIGIQLPTDALTRFGIGENFYHLVRLLDVEQIIQLFVYMLTEQKILLTSTCNSDLTGIAEALIAMIFPFKWSIVYIPFLYLRCIHIIQSPSPYLIGVDSRFFDFFRLPDGVGCVDLVTKSIKPPDTNCKHQLNHDKVLPKSVLKSLRNGLTDCKKKVSSFEKQQTIRKTTGNFMDEFTIIRRRESIGESIRECFLRAVTLMFRNYQAYLIPLSLRMKQGDMFSPDEFLKSVDRNCRTLYQTIFETQLWNNFILERSYATQFDDGLAFFDRCIRNIRDIDDDTANAIPLLQTDSIIKSEHTRVVPPPDPVDGWQPDGSSRRTFPKRLSSQFMLPSIHNSMNETNVRHIGSENGMDVNYNTPVTSNIGDKYHEYGSDASLTSPDSSIPTLLIKVDTCLAGIGPNMRNRRSTTMSVLKRPFEEQKEARLRGEEAKQGDYSQWSGYLLSSSYCLWFLSLPGLIGYVEEIPGLKETGLSERILQLALELLASMHSMRLVLPDEVCYRIVLILIHQLKPPRLRVSELLKHSDLNAFSYGLCNQILLEEEQHQSTLMTSSNQTNPIAVTPIKHEQTNSDASDKSIPCKTESKDERDCDSGRETLASTSIAPEETQDSNDSGINSVQKPSMSTNQQHCVIEVGGKAVQLRGRHQNAKNRNNRISQLIIHSAMVGDEMESNRNSQLIDPKAGIIMSSLNRPIIPVLAMYRSPIASKPTSTEEVSPAMTTPPPQIVSTTPAIIARTPFSEERSELHASYLIKKRVSIDNESNADDKLAESFDSPVSSLDSGQRSRMSDSRLTQSDFGSDKVALKTRATFRQFKSAANRSLRSMRDIVTSVGSGSWLTPPDSRASQDIKLKPLPAGLPAPFRPWVVTNSGIQENNGVNLPSRLKTTASADLLDTIADHHDNVHLSRNCAGTVQQTRRFTPGSHWPPSDSYESLSSDQRYDKGSSTNSVETDPQFASVDKVYDKVTGSLAAIRLPTGKYWPEELDGDPSIPFTECTQCIQVLITSASICDTCHRSIYDDDIMNGWSHDDSDLQSTCPYCRNKKIRFTPKLTFQVLINQLETDSQDGRRSSPRSALAYGSNVCYLSPCVLRKELESVLQQEGEVALLKAEFVHEHPILYWNLIWYYSRLGLPTHLSSFLTMWLRRKGQLLAASREDNRNRFQVLLDLTGHEQVFVTHYWEFAQFNVRSGLSLYHRFYREPDAPPNISPVHRVLERIKGDDLYGALCILIEMRLSVNGQGESVWVPQERSIYRELYFLITAALDSRINYDVFHDMYADAWKNACRKYNFSPLLHDHPPLEKSLYCRRLFRPLSLGAA